MRTQTFGIEMELTGITRSRAARAIEKFFGTQSFEHEGGYYDKYTARDRKGRKWTAMSDSSINTRKKVNGTEVSASGLYSTEVVSPILTYDDLEDLQELVRQLRHAGAMVNSSCGIHIHIGAAEFKPETLRNLVNTIASKEDILYRALQIDPNRLGYCQKTNKELIKLINKHKPATRNELADIWYREAPSGRNCHYNRSRYHGLNLHAYFTKGTVEFRLFNGTTHAGEIKAYIQFCMAVAHKAKTTKKALPRKTESDNEKYAMRCWLLRLGLIGDEFKTCRHHMIKHLEGNSAWRRPS